MRCFLIAGVRRRSEIVSEVQADRFSNRSTISTVTHAELDARTVFERDRDEINKSDILLALLDEPSHGVGAEIVFALNRGMVVLGAAADSKKISRFIIGLLEGSEKGHYIRYHRFEEVIEELLRQTEPRSRILSQIA